MYIMYMIYIICMCIYIRAYYVYIKHYLVSIRENLMGDTNLYTQRNLNKSNRNQIIFTIFRMILSRTEFHLVPHQSENSEYNQISPDSARIRSLFFGRSLRLLARPRSNFKSSLEKLAF